MSERRPRGGGPWRRRGERPEWWPEGERWPPRRERHGWHRFGCLFGLIFVLGVLGIVSFASSMVGGILAAPGPGGHVIRLAAIVIAVGAIVTVLRTGWTIRRTAVVLDEIVEQAGRVEAGDYAARVVISDPAPGAVRSLARGFNTMAARLEADERQRRSLLADVTHELRTPLTVISGNVEAILDGVHPADEAHLGTILDETRVLSRLVDDLRTLALSEAGSLSLHREPTDLDVLCAEVVAAFAAAAQDAGVELTAAVDEDVPIADVDPVRVREVLGNLVGNALRYTPAGGHVRLEGRRVAGERGRDDLVELAVRDTGSGIPADLLPHVFDRFARGAGSTGTGLGLAIARGLVELHGGTITAAAAPGGGTLITVRLPLAA